MDYPKKYTQAFAATGDYNVIPDSPSQPGEGFASFSEGFPPELSQPFAQSGKAVKRLDINGIFNRLTQFQMYQQAGGMFKYDASIEYDPPAIVWDEAVRNFYQCVSANGPSTFTQQPSKDSKGQYWVPLITQVKSRAIQSVDSALLERIHQLEQRVAELENKQ